MVNMDNETVKEWHERLDAVARLEAMAVGYDQVIW